MRKVSLALSVETSSAAKHSRVAPISRSERQLEIIRYLPHVAGLCWPRPDALRLHESGEPETDCQTTDV